MLLCPLGVYHDFQWKCREMLQILCLIRWSGASLGDPDEGYKLETPFLGDGSTKRSCKMVMCKWEALYIMINAWHSGIWMKELLVNFQRLCLVILEHHSLGVWDHVNFLLLAAAESPPFFHFLLLRTSLLWWFQNISWILTRKMVEMI